MIEGRFGENKELFFEVIFVGANGEQFSTEALLDTGFTDGWLAINSQDECRFRVVFNNLTSQYADSTRLRKV